MTATVLGLCYLTLAGAPSSYMAVNGGAAAIGVLLYWLIHSLSKPGRANFTVPAFVSSLVLLATTALGTSSAGAHRWMAVGPLNVQLSFILLPLILASFARAPRMLGAMGVSIAAVALALQPDRGMAGVIVLAVSTLAAMRFERVLWLSLAAAAVSFGVAMSRPDNLPAMPYVEQILFTAFDISFFAGAVVVSGALLLLLPAIIRTPSTQGKAHEYIIFGSVWLGIIMAAALGNYPTPVVGYSGSAVLGYFLSVAMLPYQAGKPADYV